MIVPWQPDWADRFAEARAGILALFEQGEAVVEHVGSTAVPGLAAKPIVDMMLGVRRLAEIERQIPALEAQGWEYIPERRSSRTADSWRGRSRGRGATTCTPSRSARASGMTT